MASLDVCQRVTAAAETRKTNFGQSNPWIDCIREL